MGPAEVKAGVARMCAPERLQRAAIGGKRMNSGIRGGLWDEKHFRRMGSAIWLFGWLVHRQTTQLHGEGLVLRGKPIDYAMISADTGFSERTVRRWMAALISGGYVSVKHTCYKRLVIRVLNAKKFAPLQLGFAQSFPHGNPQEQRPTLAVIAARSGRFKEGAEIEQKLQIQNPRQTPARSTASLRPDENGRAAENEQRRRILMRDRRISAERSVRAEARVGAGPQVLWRADQC